MREEDPNVAEEVDGVDKFGMDGGHTNTKDEAMDKEIMKEINEVDTEIKGENLLNPGDLDHLDTQAETEVQKSHSILDDVTQSITSVHNSPITINENEDPEDFSDSFKEVSDINDDDVIGTDNEISESLDDASDKRIEESELIVSEVDPSQVSETESLNKDDLSVQESELNTKEGEEIIEFGSDIEKPDSEVQIEETSEIQEETASQKTKEELEGNELLTEFEDKVTEGAPIKEENHFEHNFNLAMEKAISEHPNSESVVVIAYDKDTQQPEIKNIKVKDFRDGEYKRSQNVQNQEIHQIIDDKIKTKIETEKKAEQHKSILHQNILNLEKEKIEQNILAGEHTIPQLPGSTPNPHLQGLSNSKDYREFENVGFEQELYNQQEAIAREEKKDQATTSDQYLDGKYQAKQALKLFAEEDAKIRAKMNPPPGLPMQVFLSDLMGVSEVGEYKPTANMIQYYGSRSGFEGYFIYKSKNNISFEDIDTLTGLLSDLNGIFTTVYNLLPTKKEAEKEQNPIEKSNIEKAYEVLKFYARIRGFVHTLVFNRHLIVQDIQFLKNKIDSLYPDHADMLKFYGVELEYAQVKSKSSKFPDDQKIEAHLKKIHGVSYDFGRDVKIALESLFTLEKTIIFFDNDARELAQGINTENPLVAIQTVDKVILFIIRLFEVKLDLFSSMLKMKDSLEQLKRHRSVLLEELRSAHKLIHYYELTSGMNILRVDIRLFISLLVAWTLLGFNSEEE